MSMRMYTNPALVGRKPRRAEHVANSFGADRAGFEPRRAAGYTHESGRTQTLDSGQLSIATPRARLKSGANYALADGRPSARRDPPPLRFGAARPHTASRQRVGRDVGFAKSGFRPTGAGPKAPQVHARSVT